MEKNKKIKHPAVRMKKKRAKLLAQLTYCCIPATVVKTEVVEYEDGTKKVVNPDIKPNGNGTFGTAGKYYREIKAKRVAYLNEAYSGKSVKGHKRRRKQPWYMLTKGKCYNYEERKTPYGTRTDSFRVKSEQKIFHDMYNIPKLTKEELVTRLLSAKMQDWEKKNPKPEKDGNLFYSQQIDPWIAEYEAAHDKIVKQLGIEKYTKRVTDFILDSRNKHSKERIEERNQEWQNKKAA